MVLQVAKGQPTHRLNPVARMEQVQVFLALLCQLSCHMCVLIDKLFDIVADVGLSAELDRSESADAVSNNFFGRILLVQVHLCLGVGV